MSPCARVHAREALGGASSQRRRSCTQVLFAAAAAGRAVIVDFTAQWVSAGKSIAHDTALTCLHHSQCGPCQRIAPAFDALASEFSWCDFIKVDGVAIGPNLVPSDSAAQLTDSL